MPARIAVAFSVIVVLLASLGGCGGAEMPSVPPMPSVPALPSAADAQKAVCASLVALTSGVEQLANVNPASTVADLKALKAPVDTAVAAVKAANQVLNQANIAELTTSYDNLTATVNGLPDNAAVGETAATVRSGAASVLAALARARLALACP